MRRLRQLSESTRDVRRQDPRAEISFLRLPDPRETRLRFRLESRCRCSERRRDRRHPAARSRSAFDLWHWSGSETECLAGDRARIIANRAGGGRAWKIWDAAIDRCRFGRVARKKANHINETIRCRREKTAETSRGRNRMRRGPFRAAAGVAPKTR